MPPIVRSAFVAGRFDDFSARWGSTPDRVLARHARRPATLIAARRLTDTPTAGLRATGGIMLALFVTTVAIGVITRIVEHRGPAPVGSTDAGTLSTALATNPPSVPGTALADLRAIPGVQTAAVIHQNPVDSVAHCR